MSEMSEMSEIKFNYDEDINNFVEADYERFKKGLEYVRSVPQHEQRTPEWFKARESKLTASDWGTIMGWGNYGSPKESAFKKIFPDKATFVSNVAVEWGKKYEAVAQALYEKRNKTTVIEYGMIPHPEIDFLGASPDGITPNGIMLEIKCPYKRILNGKVPVYYWCQIQGQLECCGLDRCDYLEVIIKEITGVEYRETISKLSDEEKNNPKTPEYGLVFITDLNKTFYPSKFFMTIEEATEEIESKLEPFEEIEKISCYKIIQTNCIPIYKNTKWLYEECIPFLEKFWNNIKKCRESDNPEKTFEEWFENDPPGMVNIPNDPNIDLHHKNSKPKTTKPKTPKISKPKSPKPKSPKTKSPKPKSPKPKSPKPKSPKPESPKTKSPKSKSPKTKGEFDIKDMDIIWD